MAAGDGEGDGDGVILRYSFLCGLRGYHQYRLLWTPVLDEILTARPEIGNYFDRYAIAAYRQFGATERIVGHLPRELSRYLYFIIFHGAHIVCKVINTHHRRSPLVQGGLEIPVEVIVSMDSSDANKQALRRCQNWVELKYKEPIDGQFRDATAEILRMLQDSDESEDESSTDESNDDLGNE